jgi:3-hydroxymyristoyl/3-hydroxydecanoyl-(acyl carrier protein) dehydratase
VLPPPNSLIPHRKPQLLVDRLIAYDGATLTAEGDFAPESWPTGVPRMQLVEGLAQAMACLGSLHGEAGAAVLLGIPAAEFPAAATPPCTLSFRVEVVERRLKITEARGEVHHAGVLVCRARLTAALFDAPAEAA